MERNLSLGNTISFLLFLIITGFSIQIFIGLFRGTMIPHLSVLLYGPLVIILWLTFLSLVLWQGVDIISKKSYKKITTKLETVTVILELIFIGGILYLSL